MLFRDRREAGRQLAKRLRDHGYAIGPTSSSSRFREEAFPWPMRWPGRWTRPSTSSSCASSACPGNEEFAIGAVASGGISVRRPLLIEAYRIPDRVVDAIAAKERVELARRERAYRRTGRRSTCTVAP